MAKGKMSTGQQEKLSHVKSKDKRLRNEIRGLGAVVPPSPHFANFWKWSHNEEYNNALVELRFQTTT